MNNEEKKTIEEIENFLFEVRTFGITQKDTQTVNSIEFLLNQIEKLQKENEQLRTLLDSKNKMIREWLKN